MLRFFWCAIFYLTGHLLFAQSYEDLPLVDFTYSPRIKTVQFAPENGEIEYPILPLQSPDKLVLEFDDMEADFSRYAYRIVQCNADWTLNDQLLEMEYIRGFNGEIIEDYEASSNTVVDYVHYRLSLPNEQLTWTRSGNYLLIIHEENDPEAVVLTRRFMIVDSKMNIIPQKRRSATPPYAETHQEWTFELEYNGISPSNPKLEIKTTVLQNGNWHEALTALEPNFVRGESLVYDFQGKIMFPAYKEFRPLDLRSLNFKSGQMAELVETRTAFDAYLFADRPRANTVYSFINDLNGRYIIENFDFEDENLRGDYAQVHFSLQFSPLADGDVYIFGALSEWQLKEDFKMNYNPTKKAYEVTIPLKTGYYDYTYAFSPHANPGQVDIDRIEGSYFEAENEYLFLAYYRPFGGRYDQLVAIKRANSNK